MCNEDIHRKIKMIWRNFLRNTNLKKKRKNIVIPLFNSHDICVYTLIYSNEKEKKDVCILDWRWTGQLFVCKKERERENTSTTDSLSTPVLFNFYSFFLLLLLLLLLFFSLFSLLSIWNVYEATKAKERKMLVVCVNELIRSTNHISANI